MKTSDVVRQLEEKLQEAPEIWADYVLTEELLASFEDDADLQASVYNASQWLLYAGSLLLSSDLDINAAHNHVKHGLAIRARDDERIDFVPVSTESDAPDLSGGTVPLSFLDDAVAVLDKPLVKHLSRPKVGGHKQGLEISTLRLDTPVILAEAWMIARVHACVYAVAGHARAAGAPDFELYPPALSPTDVFPSGSVVGMRHPITLPPGGGPLTRQAGVALNRRRFVTLSFDYEKQATVTVVDG